MQIVHQPPRRRRDPLVLPHTGATPTARVLATHAMSDCARSTLDGEYGDIYIGFMLLLWSGDRQCMPGPAAGDPEALIEEARRRARLRRRRVAAPGDARAGGGGRERIRGEQRRRGELWRRPRPRRLRACARSLGAASWRFVSRGAAWALDAERGTLRRLPKPPGWTASNPVLSHDGRWLAYITAALYSRHADDGRAVAGARRRQRGACGARARRRRAGRLEPDGRRARCDRRVDQLDGRADPPGRLDADRRVAVGRPNAAGIRAGRRVVARRARDRGSRRTHSVRRSTGR